MNERTEMRCRMIGTLILWMIAGFCFGQQAEPEVTEPPPQATMQKIDDLRKRLESSQDLDETVVTSVQQLLDEAAADLVSAAASGRDEAGFDKQIETAEQRLQARTQQLDSLAGKPQVGSDQSTSALNQKLAESQSALAEAETRAAAAISEPSRRQTRLLAIPEEESELSASLEETREQLSSTRDANAAPLLAEARLARLQAKAQAEQSRLNALRKEKVAYAATSSLLPIERQVAEREVAFLRQQIALLQDALAKDRIEQIDSLRDRVDAAAEGPTSTELATLATNNLELLDQYETLASRSTEVKVLLREATERLEEVKARQTTTVARVKAVGLTEALALLLQREKSLLNRLQSEIHADANLRAEMKLLQIQTYQLEDEAIEAGPLRGDAELVEQPDTDLSTDDVTRQDLLSLKDEIIRKLVPVGATLFQDLVSLDTTEFQLRQTVDDYLEFIEENLLWTRNAPFVLASDPTASARGLQWLINPVNWRQVPGQILDSAKSSPVITLLLSLLMVVLVVSRPRWRGILKVQAEAARRSTCIELAPTLRAACITFLLAAPVPLAIFAAAIHLRDTVSEDEFLGALSHGLLITAVFIAALVFLLQVYRANGLAIDHFGWPAEASKKIRRACRDVATIGGPLVLVAEMLHSQPDDAISDSLGRYTLIGLMTVFVVVIYQVLRPSQLWAGKYGTHSILYRYSKLVFLVAMQIPMAIIILIALGYEYMTFAVMGRLLQTFIALIVIFVSQAIATRALLVRRRRLTIEQYKQRRESSSETEVAEAVGIDVASTEVDLNSVSNLARQLVYLLTMTSIVLSVGWIWSDLLPAITMLDRVELWTVGTTNLIPVTLRDLIFCILIIAITCYAVKSLPALIELFFLQPFQPGARYAITTIFRYFVGAFGVVFGLSYLSIPWSQLSWILAAASVGLGFGLQEIVANFVSGLILLLEQPIRVGDIVTVDGSTGVVSKMQIRATTVTNWDRQELIVPNKDFVTGKLLNWTLSNVINRVVINVGVAYGSDPVRVQQLLLELLNGHPEVMDDPAPLVSFEQFGDSSLNFVIRCYLPTMEKRLATIHELHTEIALAFAEANIEIPFPQRDIRMTIEPAGGSMEASPSGMFKGAI